MAGTVLSHYLITRMVTGRDSTSVTIVCPCEKMIPFIKASWYSAVVVKEATQEQIESSDMTFEFDAEGSYRLTEAVKKGIAESFAIQLGVGFIPHQAPILVEDTPEEEHSIAVVSRQLDDGLDSAWIWPHQQAFIDLLEKNEVEYNFLREDADWDEMRKVVGRARVVVGVRGTPTLMAVSGNKLVVELSSSMRGHSEWFRKSKAPTYRVIFGDLKDMNADFVWQQTQLLVAKTFAPAKQSEIMSEDYHV